MPVPPGTEDTFGPWPGDVGNTGTDTGEPTTEAIVASDIPFWKDLPQAYDHPVIAGYELPGVARISAELRRKLDKKNAKGIDGATITDDGEDQAPIEITVRLYNREHWQRFQALVPLINPKGSGKKTAVSIDYPTLALFGINLMYVEAVSVPEFRDNPKRMESTIKGTEWRPAPKAAKTSKSSTTDESKDDPKIKAWETTYITDGEGNQIPVGMEPIYEPNSDP